MTAQEIDAIVMMNEKEYCELVRSLEKAEREAYAACVET